MAVSLLLVGIGGYGNTYVNGLLDYQGVLAFKIAGVVDPRPEGCRRLAELQARRIPFFETLEDFYARGKADLAVISSPIHLHCPQTRQALANGSSVLCEKPLSATIQEARQMITARDQAGKFVVVGYQWSFSEAVLALKRDIQAGLFGKPKRLKTLVLWPRNADYYSRNRWAGKKTDNQGNWILDSVANNATAHYLHNMFFVLGQAGQSAYPVRVQAELYRANPIENFDTAAVRAYTEDGVEILYFGSHAIREALGPVFVYEFEEARVTYTHDSACISAEFADGRQKIYGNPNEGLLNKLWVAIQTVTQPETPIPCGIEAASAQTLCLNGMQEAMPEICVFPQGLIKKEGEPQLTWVTGLAEALHACYEQGQLPSEQGYPWAKSGEEIDLRGYTHFPSKATP